MVITAMALVVLFLFIFRWDYNNYYGVAKPVFDNLLGYVTGLLAFATRSVTTPIGLSVASLIKVPLALANLIIIVSGLIGATFAPVLFRNVKDDRAKGLALGLTAHVFGTVEVWQISHTAGRYAAFGLAVNGLLTAIWLPIFVSTFGI